jgi:hypothetical protein
MHQPVSSTVRPQWVLIKALLLFAAANLLFAFLVPDPAELLIFRQARRFPPIWQPALSGQGRLGFQRFLTADIDLLFKSHVISSRPKAQDEYRVVLIGDSSTWGVILKPEDTLEARINALHLRTCTGQRVVVYNLGYPFTSGVKDLLLMAEVMKYEPDLIVWPFTLLGFTAERQEIDIINRNPARARALVEKYHLPLSNAKVLSADTPPAFWQRTLLGQRQKLSLAAKLNLSRIASLALGTDEIRDYADRRKICLQKAGEGLQFLEISPPAELSQYANLDYLQIAQEIAGETPVLYVNQPICVQPSATGARYNLHYPRWAYDQYRAALNAQASEHHFYYLDLWNLLPPTEFTNTVFHRTPAGEQMMAETLAEHILIISCRQR